MLAQPSTERKFISTGLLLVLTRRGMSIIRTGRHLTAGARTYRLRRLLKTSTEHAAN